MFLAAKKGRQAGKIPTTVMKCQCTENLTFSNNNHWYLDIGVGVSRSSSQYDS